MYLDALKISSALLLFNQVGDDLSQGRSVLLLLPSNSMLPHIQHSLFNILYQRDFNIENIAGNSDVKLLETPSVWLSERLRLNPPPQSLTQLATHADFPDVCLVDGSTIPKKVIPIWLEFLQRWAIHSQQFNASDRTICFCLPATQFRTSLPSANVKLAVRWWWLSLSALETQLLCRQRSQGCKPTATWREQILSSLTGDDVTLLEALWPDVTGTVEQIIVKLAEFGQRQGWLSYRDTWQDLIRTSGLPKLSHFNGDAPPQRWRCLWDVGALCLTPEYGLEVHSAALPMLDRKNEIIHRLWRAQAALLLPLLDSVRLSLCRHLTERYSNGWQLTWATAKAPQEAVLAAENPLATQWGHLQLALSKSPERRHLLVERQLANAGRQLRNTLAHFRLVNFQDYLQFVEDWGRFQKW